MPLRAATLPRKGACVAKKAASLPVKGAAVALRGAALHQNGAKVRVQGATRRSDGGRRRGSGGASGVSDFLCARADVSGQPGVRGSGKRSARTRDGSTRATPEFPSAAFGLPELVAICPALAGSLRSLRSAHCSRGNACASRHCIRNDEGACPVEFMHRHGSVVPLGTRNDSPVWCDAGDLATRCRRDGFRQDPPFDLHVDTGCTTGIAGDLIPARREGPNAKIGDGRVADVCTEGVGPSEIDP